MLRGSTTECYKQKCWILFAKKRWKIISTFCWKVLAVYSTSSVIGFREETKDIPVAGTVLGEFSFMHYLGDKSAYTENEKYHILKERFGESTDAVVEQFEMVYPKLDILYALSVDAMFRPLTKEILEERSAYTDAPCYNYMMNFIIPYMGGLAVWHCGDIPFVFRNVEMESAHCTAVVLESIYKRKSAADDFCREMWNG